jgi:hypothetical protein
MALKLTPYVLPDSAFSLSGSIGPAGSAAQLSLSLAMPKLGNHFAKIIA